MPSGLRANSKRTPFGRPVVPLEYNMSVPSIRSLSGVTEHCARACSKLSYPETVPSIINRKSTPGVVLRISVA